jgi:hypothetical protein
MLSQGQGGFHGDQCYISQTRKVKVTPDLIRMTNCKSLLEVIEMKGLNGNKPDNSGSCQFIYENYNNVVSHL